MALSVKKTSSFYWWDSGSIWCFKSLLPLSSHLEFSKWGRGMKFGSHLQSLGLPCFCSGPESQRKWKPQSQPGLASPAFSAKWPADSRRCALFSLLSYVMYRVGLPGADCFTFPSPEQRLLRIAFFIHKIPLSVPSLSSTWKNTKCEILGIPPSMIDLPSFLSFLPCKLHQTWVPGSLLEP